MTWKDEIRKQRNMDKSFERAVKTYLEDLEELKEDMKGQGMPMIDFLEKRKDIITLIGKYAEISINELEKEIKSREDKGEVNNVKENKKLVEEYHRKNPKGGPRGYGDTTNVGTD